MADDALTSAKGALWIQPDGPNTEPKYLGCHDLEPLVEPSGNISLIRCFSPSGDGWDTKGSTSAPPDPVTTTINTLLFRTQGYLEALGGCKFPLYAFIVEGRLDVFTNYIRGSMVAAAKITSRSRRNIVRRDEDAQAEFGVDIQAEPPVIDVFQLYVDRLGIAATEPLVGIAFENAPVCATSTQVAKDACKRGYVTTSAILGSAGDTASVWETDDYAGSWAATAADPFGGGLDLGAIQVFTMGRDVLRILVALGETVGGTPARVAYSDDRGATWNVVNVGAVNAQYFIGGLSLIALDLHHIWAVATGGYIYFSNDGGATWTAQTSGSLTAQNLNAVHFCDEDTGLAGGAANALLKTVDGATWSAVTGPAAMAANGVNCVCVKNRNQWWVGYDSGHLYYTMDGGATWGLRSFSGSATGAVKDVKFADVLNGFMVHEVSAVGTVFVTRNGGYDWEALTTPSNDGLNMLAVCGPNSAYVVGDSESGTGVLLKVHV